MIASAQSGRSAAVLALAADRHVPGAVHHDAVLDDVRIGAAVLLDVVRVVLDDADRAVAAVGRVAVGSGKRVGGIEREAAPVPALQLQLQRVELTLAGVLGDVHERAVDREGQPGLRHGIGVHVAKRHRARLHAVHVPVHQQLLHRRADVADAGADTAGQLAFEREVVLVDVRQLEIEREALVAEAERRASRVPVVKPCCSVGRLFVMV